MDPPSVSGAAAAGRGRATTADSTPSAGAPRRLDTPRPRTSSSCRADARGDSARLPTTEPAAAPTSERDRTMLGGYISDLEAGDVFEPVEYVLTAFMASEYAHGVEEHWEWFHSSRAPG